MDLDYFLRQSFIKILIASFFSCICIDTKPTEVFFNGKQYISYKPSKQPVFERANMNRIHLEFRTIHSNGVLVVMKGKGDDVLVLQLVNGGLRYLISRSSQKHMEYSIGSNLDDNQWHTVNILRTETLNEFILDNETKISLSPKTYETLSLDKQILIGGGGGYKSISKKQYWYKSIGKSMFSGCLKVHKIDNRDPIAYLMEGNNRVQVLPGGGQLRTNCTKLTTQPISLSKMFSSLLVRIDKNRTASHLKLNLSVRTYSMNGKIVSTRKGNYSVHISMKNGFVVMNLLNREHKRALFTLKAPPISISGGTWHTLYVAVTNDSALIQVDKSLYKQKLENVTGSLFLNPKQLFLGTNNETYNDNFIGCLHGVKLNSETVPIVIPETKKNEIVRFCKLSCKPNPCQNKGVCSQKGNEFHCDCSKTNFYGKQCEIYKYKSSCTEYKEMGLRKPSFCLLDADGTGDLDPYTTKCDFSDTQEAYTAVHHNYRDIIDSSKDRGLQMYNYQFYRLVYEVDATNIESLIKKSSHCRQKVVLSCKNAAPFNPYHGQLIHWRTRKMLPESYWGGVQHDGKGCACGKTKTCNDKYALCNCASATKDWAEDAGYLTEKQYLPVQRLKLHEDSIVNGSVMLYVGPLECFGSKTKRAAPVAPQDGEVLKNILADVCMTVTKKESLLLSAKTNVSESYLEVEDELPYDPTHPAPATTSHRSSGGYQNRTAFISALTARTFFTSARSFGVLEIIVLSFAGLAFSILVIKFICCDRFCSRGDRGELILNQDCCMRDEFYESVGSRSNEGTMTKNNNGLPQNMKVTPNPLSSYWV